MKLFKKILLFLFIGVMVLMFVPKSYGSTPKPKPAGIQGPILVVDKCPQFCPPGIKRPVRPIQMCTQALIPVPGKPGWWYTDGCKKNMIKMGRR